MLITMIEPTVSRIIHDNSGIDIVVRVTDNDGNVLPEEKMQWMMISAVGQLKVGGTVSDHQGISRNHFNLVLANYVVEKESLLIETSDGCIHVVGELNIVVPAHGSSENKDLIVFHPVSPHIVTRRPTVPGAFIAGQNTLTIAYPADGAHLPYNARTICWASYVDGNGIGIPNCDINVSTSGYLSVPNVSESTKLKTDDKGWLCLWLGQFPTSLMNTSGFTDEFLGGIKLTAAGTQDSDSKTFNISKQWGGRQYSMPFKWETVLSGNTEYAPLARKGRYVNLTKNPMAYRKLIYIPNNQTQTQIYDLITDINGEYISVFTLPDPVSSPDTPSSAKYFYSRTILGDNTVDDDRYGVILGSLLKGSPFSPNGTLTLSCPNTTIITKHTPYTIEATYTPLSGSRRVPIVWSCTSQDVAFERTETWTDATTGITRNIITGGGNSFVYDAGIIVVTPDKDNQVANGTVVVRFKDPGPIPSFSGKITLDSPEGNRLPVRKLHRIYAQWKKYDGEKVTEQPIEWSADPATKITFSPLFPTVTDKDGRCFVDIICDVIEDDLTVVISAQGSNWDIDQYDVSSLSLVFEAELSPSKVNKITGITIDKQLADNLPKSQPVIGEKIPASQLIQVTATVVNNKGDAQSGAIVQFRTMANVSNMHIFDKNKKEIIPSPKDDVNTFKINTDGKGKAIIYMASPIKIITNISASLTLPKESGSPEYEQTLVFCTFDDSGTLPAPELLTDEHGRVEIKSEVYSVKAFTEEKPSKPDYWCAAWLYGKVDGYLDDALKGRLINVFPVQKNSPVTFDVPYQWMDTKNKYGNQLAYLLYENNGSSKLSKKLVFPATGAATAMPDIDEPGEEGYCKVVYLYDESATLLTNNDLNKYGNILEFYIPRYPDCNTNDKLEINIYLNGWDLNGINPRHKQIQQVKYLKELVSKKGQYTFFISKDQVAGFGISYKKEFGNMFIRYKVNDEYLSMIYIVKIDFSDIL
ncbi:hypothetical protein [Photorhabdus viridis]|uniref:hypothetical protein n=1 Tax=Photorhabdus viridis TaxID=3163327 RepID=UPI003306D19E